jgi:hypothetical protein
VIPGDTWPLMIPNNSYQYQIVTNNTWYQLVSLGFKNTSSIHCQYDTDGLVSVWYCHGTDSGNFQKTFDA